jgi:hypothetical protein
VNFSAFKQLACCVADGHLGKVELQLASYAGIVAASGRFIIP